MNFHKSRAMSLYLIKYRILVQSVLSADKTPHTNKEILYQHKVTVPEVLLVIEGRYTRGSLLLKHAPETRSWVSTPTSAHERHDDGACSRSTLLQHAPGAKLPRLQQRFLAKKLLLPSFARQANFSTHEGACS